MRTLPIPQFFNTHKQKENNMTYAWNKNGSLEINGSTTNINLSDQEKFSSEDIERMLIEAMERGEF